MNLSDNRYNVWEMEALGKSLPMMTVDEARNVELAQIEIKVEHHFSLGIYARTMYMPKNAVVVGKLHKYPQLNILSQGEVTVRSGDEVKRLKAPYMYSAPAGTKRVLYAHEDVVWTTILGTHETDVEKIEHYFIAETEQEYIKFIGDYNPLRDPVGVIPIKG